MSETTTERVRKAEPHRFVPPAMGTRDAEFGWCARLDCGFAADAYVHASEEERRAFDSRPEAKPAESLLITRPRNRAVEAATDAAIAIRHDEIGAARVLLAEAARHLDTLEEARTRQKASC